MIFYSLFGIVAAIWLASIGRVLIGLSMELLVSSETLLGFCHLISCFTFHGLFRDDAFSCRRLEDHQRSDTVEL